MSEVKLRSQLTLFDVTNLVVGAIIGALSLKNALIAREAVLERAYRQEGTFLAHLLSHLKRAYRKATGKEQTWETTD